MLTLVSDIAGSILALTLQISALFQMTFRILVESHSRFASVSSILHYTKNLPLEESDAPVNPKSDEISPSSLIFKDVSLRYRKELPRVLRNLNIVISKGEHVGVVGRTGSGKSSLFTVLFHLSDATEGDVIINGRSTKNATLQELRKSLALIPQDPTLFGLPFHSFSYITSLLVALSGLTWIRRTKTQTKNAFMLLKHAAWPEKSRS